MDCELGISLVWLYDGRFWVLLGFGICLGISCGCGC